MNYDELLIKYMDHIITQEGTDYTGISLDVSNEFTEEEKEELRKLSAMV